MLNQTTGYSAANPQTKYAVLGCGLALIGIALGFGLLITLGMLMG